MFYCRRETPRQACNTWMTWTQPMFCASSWKGCRDIFAVNGRKKLPKLGVTRDSQPTSIDTASLCPNKPIWRQMQSTQRKIYHSISCTLCSGRHHLDECASSSATSARPKKGTPRWPEVLYLPHQLQWMWDKGCGWKVNVEKLAPQKVEKSGT